MRNISATERAECRCAKMCKSSSTALTAMVAVAALVALGGCVTPIEVKKASKAQLDLITALDSAAADLQQSLAQFNQSIATRIREDGRIRIAAQAIEVAYPQMSNADVTSNALFKGHEASVQPWIDNALISQDIDAAIAQIQDQKKKTTNPALQIQLDNEEQDLQKRKLSLANKPPQVREIEGVIVNNRNSQLKTATEINKVLDILRAQIAVMKQMAARVDAWLAIDVTVTQEQADALRAAFSAAASSVGAGK